MSVITYSPGSSQYKLCQESGVLHTFWEKHFNVGLIYRQNILLCTLLFVIEFYAGVNLAVNVIIVIFNRYNNFILLHHFIF